VARVYLARRRLIGRGRDGGGDHWPIAFLLRGLQDERRVGGGVLRAQPLDRREISGIRNDGRVALQAVQQRTHGR
jgi:hypothetical protein